jgi:hypothetical protein
VIPLLGIYPKECKTGYTRDTCTMTFITALLTIAKSSGNNSDALQLMNGSRNCGIYTQWSITQSQGVMTCGLKVNGCNWRTSC